MKIYVIRLTLKNKLQRSTIIMIKNLIIVFGVIVVASAISFELPVVNIDLSGPPEQRWVEAYNTVINAHGYESTFGTVFSLRNDTFSMLTNDDFELIGSSLRKHFPKYASELDGLVKAFNRPDVTYNYLAAWVYFHELGHVGDQKIKECTAVVYQADDGTILHGRNMDQFPYADRLIALHLKLYLDGKLVGEVADWYWFNTGFVTAFKPQVASMQGNWRDQITSKAALLQKISEGVKSQVWLFRDVIEDYTLNNFDAVVNYLKDAPTGAAMYNIVAGVSAGQGVIISRDIEKELPLIRLNDPSSFLNQSKKALVQTNYDHWEQDPQDDSRRTQAENIIEAAESSYLSTPQGIYHVMDQYEVHNEDTLYTVVMIPKTGYFKAVGQLPKTK